MIQCNYILGSGLISLIAKEILGDKWKIIPFSTSRFYSNGPPAWGDDFIEYQEKHVEIFNNLNFNTVPMFYKRGLSIEGQIVFNEVFIPNYLNKIGYSDTELGKKYFKTIFNVFQFSCIQLWEKLIRKHINEIQKYYTEHKNSKKINKIFDHKILLDNGDILEYNKIVSTVPYYILSKLLNIDNECNFKDLYYYFIESENIDISEADQLLVCDNSIFFHKCTKIKNKYLFEVIDKYFDNPYEEFSKIIGRSFEIIKAHTITKAFVTENEINKQELDNNSITCVGSYAQCDPLMDVNSCMNRLWKIKN